MTLKVCFAKSSDSVSYTHLTSVGLMHTAYDTIQVNPFQINRENPFQNGSKEKGRQRNTDQCKNGNCIINPAVLLRCRYNTQRYGNDNFQQEGGQCQSKRIPDNAGKFLFYRLMENPGFSKFTMNSFSTVSYTHLFAGFLFLFHVS